MNYEEILEYLYRQLPAFQNKGATAYKADLSNTYALSKVLNHPERKFKSIHVAGTNGKGSCSHMLASVFQEAGYKTGLYTSPHLKDFRERIRINGEMISKNEVKDFVDQYQIQFENIGLSFFEWTVGLAFHFFAQQKVDIAIIETGMGGRLDSTNIINPELSVITNIGLDHTQFLGDTLTKIAGEKAGIIKSSIPVIIGQTQEETTEVFIAKAKEMNATILFADEIDDTPLPSCDLKGSYQQHNLRTVTTALQLLKKEWSISTSAITSGLNNVIRNTGLLGRWQVLSTLPLTIADTAHNKEGLRHTIQQLLSTPHQKLHIVFGMVSDKNASSILQLLPSKAEYYLCSPNVMRGMKVEELKQHFDKQGLSNQSYNSVSSAYNAALKKSQKEDIIYIGGSTFVVAEIL